MDRLYGEAGSDQLYGGADNDEYYHALQDHHVDLINDDLNSVGYPGAGGGDADVIFLTDTTGANIWLGQAGNDLLISSAADVSDGSFDDGVVVQNFFLGGNNVVEFVFGSDGVGYDLQPLVGPPALASQSVEADYMMLG